MANSRARMARWQHPSAMVVCVCDNCVSGRGRSLCHCSCDLFVPVERDSCNRGSASAEKRAERAGSFGGSDHVRKKLNQFRAKWLMKVIAKSATHFFVIPRCERCGNRTCVRT